MVDLCAVCGQENRLCRISKRCRPTGLTLVVVCRTDTAAKIGPLIPRIPVDLGGFHTEARIPGTRLTTAEPHGRIGRRKRKAIRDRVPVVFAKLCASGCLKPFDIL